MFYIISTLLVRGGGSSNMKVTYMCLPKYEAFGIRICGKKGAIWCRLKKKKGKNGCHSVCKNVIFMPELANCTKSVKISVILCKTIYPSRERRSLSVDWRKNGVIGCKIGIKKGLIDRQSISTNIIMGMPLGFYCMVYVIHN